MSGAWVYLCDCAALPKPPTGLVVSDLTANSARLTWNSGNTDPVQSYVLSDDDLVLSES